MKRGAPGADGGDEQESSRARVEATDQECGAASETVETGAGSNGGAMAGFHLHEASGWYISDSDPQWQFDPATHTFFHAGQNAFFRYNAETGGYDPCASPWQETKPQPQTDKTMTLGGFDMETALSCMQGKRPRQEDRHVILSDLRPLVKNLPPDVGPTAFISIYDGHLGVGASEFAEANLHKMLLKHLNEALEKGAPLQDELVNDCIKKAFVDCDTEYLRIAKIRKHADGSCAVCAMVLGRKVFFFHVGDSRAVMLQGTSAVRMTEDHKPDAPQEQARIEAAGGAVVHIGGVARVSAMSLEDQAKRPKNSPRLLQLAVARTLGDLTMKKPLALVSSEPEIRIHELIPEQDKAIILACDGVWDVKTDQQVVDSVADKDKLQDGTSEIVKSSYAAGSTDNISVIGLRFSWKQTEK
eukprot:m.128826 g.128826  ORF g.128826 m.128826 type:complete len:414 (+) comp16748_c1_seq4:51-1292(+)